ncbi:hypothetical protein [Falsiphaeobacter marinintestinus]|uniref:hypothetical protein n=1 Tax=Falsiphaeobacter marinintestinus TaxID=1492905 RepID=UPI0011B704B4|nr:hypothetical protein [Phaeobacter marinintestinus]
MAAVGSVATRVAIGSADGLTAQEPSAFEPVRERPIFGGATTTTIMISNGAAVQSENAITGRGLTPIRCLGEYIAP